ncbi:MAG: TonB family protein [Bacteroidota bacterium]
MPIALSQEPVPADSTAEQIICYVQPSPLLIGGVDSLLALGHYPDVDEEVSGRVFVAVEINADGVVVNAEVLRGLGAAFDAEALRIARLARFEMPPDLPRSLYSIPVRFDVGECLGDQPTICR